MFHLQHNHFLKNLRVLTKFRQIFVFFKIIFLKFFLISIHFVYHVVVFYSYNDLRLGPPVSHPTPFPLEQLKFINIKSLDQSLCCFLKIWNPTLVRCGISSLILTYKKGSSSSLNYTSPLHLRLFVILPNCFGYLLFTSIS